MRIGGTRVGHLTIIYLNSYYNGKNQWTFTWHAVTPFTQKSTAQAKIGLCGALFLLGQRLMISLRQQQSSCRCSNLCFQRKKCWGREPLTRR